MNWKLLWEAAKEPLRLLVLSIIPVLLVTLGEIHTVWAFIIIAILRFVDKYLHLQAPEGESGGLVRF